MKIQPLHNRILIQVTEIEQKTESGLFIPETVKRRLSTAVVVKVYEEYFNDQGVLKKPIVKPGDVVFYNVILDDIGLPDKQFLIDEKSIIAKVEK